MSNVSVNSRPNHSPPPPAPPVLLWPAPRESFEWPNSTQREYETLASGQKITLKTPPPGKIFSQIQGKQQKIETEIREGAERKVFVRGPILVEAASRSHCLLRTITHWGATSTKDKKEQTLGSIKKPEA